MNDTCDAIIVAAGSGTRLGASVPKAFVTLNGIPLLLYACKVFKNYPDIGRVILVVPDTMVEKAEKLCSEISEPDMLQTTTGGAQRWESVRNGVVCSQAKWVLVHDAARPFVTTEVIHSVLEKKSKYECVITATPMVDTIRMYNGDHAGKTIDRSKLVRVGTPQLFNRRRLLDALALAETMEPSPTDEAQLFEQMGIPVGIAWGDPRNFKITTPEDLEIAEALIGRTRT